MGRAYQPSMALQGTTCNLNVTCVKTTYMEQHYKELAEKRLAWLFVAFSIAFCFACALFLASSLAIFIYWN